MKFATFSFVMLAAFLTTAPPNSGSSCNRSASGYKAYTVRVEDGDVVRSETGDIELVEVEVDLSDNATPRIVTPSGFGLIESIEECETNSSSPDGRRSSCMSGGFQFICPAGYYRVKRRDTWAHIEIISERGSESNYHLDWYNDVEIYPGTAIFVPTKVTWAVSARSNKGPNGSPGKTKAKFTCELRKLPSR